MLNRIDARSATAHRIAGGALIAFKKSPKLTYDPRNIEDLSGPAQLREDVLDLISRMSSSFQAPTAAQLAQAATYKAQSRCAARLATSTYESSKRLPMSGVVASW